MHYPCYCAEFGDEPAPEEQQRCSLIEWVGVEGRRLIFEEELANLHEDTRSCGRDNAADSDGEWSFVDEYCGVRSCTSAASSSNRTGE